MLLTALTHRPIDSPSASTAPTTNVTAAIAAIQQIHLAENAAELLERLGEAVTTVGAGAGLYAAVIPESDGEHSTFTIFACDPRFATEQAALGPIEQHPWLRYAQGHTLPATDRQISVQNPMDEAAIRLSARFGFNSHLVVPTGHGLRLQRVEMLCIGSCRTGAFDGEQARVLCLLARALAGELHDWLTQRLSHNLRDEARLQATDLQLLQMEWQGLSSKVIAQRTGMSVASVDSRFQRLNVRLNCRSRSTSARRAAEYGLLESC